MVQGCGNSEGVPPREFAWKKRALEKINNEREYCFRYFSSLAPIRDIEARFSISRGGKKVAGYENASIMLRGGGMESKGYPSIQIIKDFFAEHPEWELAAIEGVINK